MGESILIVAGIAAVLVVLVILFARNTNQRKKNLKKRIHNLWGNPSDRECTDADLEAVSHYYLHKKGKDFTIDDITWNDLDMDDVFRQLDHTFTSAGEEVLYDTLRTPSFSEKELKKRDELADYFAGHEKEREDVQYLLAHIGRTRHLSISDYIDQTEGLSTSSNILHYMCIFLIVAAIIVLLFSPSFGIVFLLVVLVFNILTYYREKGKVEPYFVSLEYLARMTKYADRIADLPADGVLADTYADLKKTTKRLSKVKKGIGMLSGNSEVGGNPLQVIEDYLMILFHFDLIRFNSLLNVVQENILSVYGLLDKIGKIELALLTASYREMMPVTSVPKLRKDGGTALKAENMVHPLIADPVANSIKTERPVLLTGSNASGKSTFLRTVAINAILAQTIHTVLADEYEGPFCRVYSSMTLSDDLSSGESYYIVEIKSLKRIMEASKDQPIVFCFIDEVLRGTNTIERIASSSQILKELAEEKTFCIAATHDIELTDLLKDYYANYHFDEVMEEGNVLFNYKLQEGKSTSRNAIRLLSRMGYDEKITKAAEESAENFSETGEWKLQ